MSESIRKTQARVAEREHRRRQQEQREKITSMLPFAILGAIIIIGIGVLVYLNTPQAATAIGGPNGPKFQVDRQELNLGDRKFNQPVRAAFNITNTGDSNLTLTAPKLVTAVEGC